MVVSFDPATNCQVFKCSSLHLSGTYYIQFTENRWSPAYMPIKKRKFSSEEAEKLCGTRQNTLTLNGGSETFGNIYNFLKKQQITCSKLILHGASKLSDEQFSTILELVKPEKIKLYKIESHIWESPLLLQTISTVEAVIGAKEVALALDKLLPTFPNVNIIVYRDRNRLDLLRMVVKYLSQTSLPNPKKFQFSIEVEEKKARYPSRIQLEEEFSDLLWEEEKGEYFAKIESQAFDPYKIAVIRNRSQTKHTYYIVSSNTASFPVIF